MVLCSGSTDSGPTSEEVHRVDDAVSQVATTSRPTDLTDFGELEQYRKELTGYCYRMLGSSYEAEDAVQDALIKAWRAIDRFEGRSSLRTWLYRIATNVCYDLLKGRKRRARPMDISPASTVDTAVLGSPLPEITWLEPIPNGRVLTDGNDPAERAVQRDSIRLAFIAALQHLPPRQRSVLILREVLRWKAKEVADLLDTTVASVNSALQRARATLSEQGVSDAGTSEVVSEDNEELLAQYVEAFERYDIDRLVSLLRDDATLSMPPYNLWISGPEEIGKWHLGPGIGCQNSRLVPVMANGSKAFGHYKLQEGVMKPWAIQIVETKGDWIVGLNAFLDTDRMFPLFGLPPIFEGS
ncbi:MAG: sigma-70 family RNA polymerase sigma factor [Acidimicrobiia bacterium]|nr:sigma-70 family RNA polymerase sigma factor [Acidimicrobiia bacterium]